MKKLVDKYNNRDATLMGADDDVVNDFIDNLSEEAKKITEEIEKNANEFQKLEVSCEEKTLYDILKTIRDKYEFDYAEDKLIPLSKRVKIIIDDKSKYIDWLSKPNIRAGLQSDLIRLLSQDGYSPKYIDDLYGKNTCSSGKF